MAVAVTLGVVAQDRQIRLPERPQRAAYHEQTDIMTGFWCAAELDGGSTVYLKDSNTQFATLTFTAGYRFSEFIRIGAGLGGRYYFLGNDDVRDSSVPWSFPVFVNARGSFLSQYTREMTPYWSVNLGCLIRDGFFFQPTIGLRFGQRRDAFLLALTYNIQHMDSKLKSQETASAIMLRLGYEF